MRKMAEYDFILVSGGGDGKLVKGASSSTLAQQAQACANDILTAGGTGAAIGGAVGGLVGGAPGAAIGALAGAAYAGGQAAASSPNCKVG